MNNKSIQNEYRVLARKYRPQTFSELVGQEILVQTVSNAIITNRIAHAYLLTGVRGVGKTTTARLIAMSINCEKRKKDSCEPCGICTSCSSISNDSNIDVIEMDAASKTGVDDIREIIDNVKYRPVNCKYKIFIIDEVHMLSKNAFNALLKTLEEPPEHIKFIFATTEAKKIPVTIISRCQRFDLRRIDDNSLNKHLELIAKKENIKIDQDAISLIVRASEGSARDGLSLLDQSLNNQNENISAISIINMLGLADRGNIFDLMEKILEGNAPTSLEIYNQIYQSGADVIMIFDEMLKVTHFLTQLKILPELKNDSQIPEFERKKGFEISEKISLSSLGNVWQVLFKGYQELQSGLNLFQHGEMLIIRLIYIYDGPSPDDLIKKIEIKLDTQNVNNNLNQTIIQKDKSPSLTNNINENITEDEVNNEEKNNTSLRIRDFRHFVDLFYQKKEAMLHTYLYNNVKLISFKEGEVVISEEYIKDSHFTRNVAKFISKWTGRIWTISTSNSNIGKTLFEEDILIQQKEISKMKNDPEIKEILKNYSNAKIHSITDIGETTDEKIILEKIKN